MGKAQEALFVSEKRNFGLPLVIGYRCEEPLLFCFYDGWSLQFSHLQIVTTTTATTRY